MIFFLRTITQHIVLASFFVSASILFLSQKSYALVFQSATSIGMSSASAAKGEITDYFFANPAPLGFTKSTTIGAFFGTNSVDEKANYGASISDGASELFAAAFSYSKTKSIQDGSNLSLAISKQISDRLSVGISGNKMQKVYLGNAGLAVKMEETFSAGFFVGNLIQTENTFNLPKTYQVGLSLKASDSLRIEVDPGFYQSKNSSNKTKFLALAGEITLAQAFKGRVSYKFDGPNLRTTGLGAGIEAQKVGIHYGYSSTKNNVDQKTNTAHTFSIELTM